MHSRAYAHTRVQTHTIAISPQLETEDSHWTEMLCLQATLESWPFTSAHAILKWRCRLHRAISMSRAITVARTPLRRVESFRRPK